MTPFLVISDRRVLKDFTFSDGTLVPKGTHIVTAFLPAQHDPDFYGDPETFNPWRYSDAREREGDSVRHALTSPNPDYLIFGIGRHAWCVMDNSEILFDANQSSAQEDFLLQTR